jgi:hypothetical protein
MGKKSYKCVGNFITDANMITDGNITIVKNLPWKKDIFGKFTMKMRNFGKFTMKKQILENLPFYGNISMEIGIMGKFPWIYGTLP